jgi:hypothetical protein
MWRAAETRNGGFQARAEARIALGGKSGEPMMKEAQRVRPEAWLHPPETDRAA